MKKLVAILSIFLASVFLFVSCAKQPSEILIAEIGDSRLYLDELLSEMEYWIYLYGMAESDASVSACSFMRLAVQPPLTMGL